MTFVPIMAGGGGAAAVAAAKKKRNQEEEEMTKYAEGDLSEGWEFKILRSGTGAFKKPEVLKRVCEEEARAGWTLLEKFDDNRLRFKRPAGSRHMGPSLGIDPYRTTYGLSEGGLVVVILGAIFGGLALILGVVYLVQGGL